MLQLLPVHHLKDHPLTLCPPGSAPVLPASLSLFCPLITAPPPPFAFLSASHLKLPLPPSTKSDRHCWLESSRPSEHWTHSPSSKPSPWLLHCPCVSQAMLQSASWAPLRPLQLFPGVVCSSSCSVFSFPVSVLKTPMYWLWPRLNVLS